MLAHGDWSTVVLGVLSTRLFGPRQSYPQVARCGAAPVQGAYALLSLIGLV